MAEKEYIERKAAVCVALGATALGNTAFSDRFEIAARLRSIQAADVRPARMGKWEAVMFDHERAGCRPTAHYCSECHQIALFQTSFCPNCGADMRNAND